jgi:uncharacterized protein (UPF0297 family)
MYAYFLAITASAAVDFLIDQKDKDLFMVFVGGATAVVSCAALAAVYNSLGDLGNAEIFAIVGCLLSLTLWWLSNSDNSKLLVTGTRADAATGGNVDLLRGEIEGYRT